MYSHHFQGNSACLLLLTPHFPCQKFLASHISKYNFIFFVLVYFPYLTYCIHMNHYPPINFSTFMIPVEDQHQSQQGWAWQKFYMGLTLLMHTHLTIIRLQRTDWIMQSIDKRFLDNVLASGNVYLTLSATAHLIQTTVHRYIMFSLIIHSTITSSNG